MEKKKKTTKKKGVKDTKIDIKKQVKQQILQMSEKKYIDNFTTSEIISGGQVTIINGLQPGGFYYNRIGKKIRMVGVRLKGEIYPNQTNTSAFNNHTEFRMCIVYDKQTNGANPTYTNIFQDRALSTTQINVASNVNIDNRERFIVIMDKRLQLPPIGITGSLTTQQQLNYSLNGIIDEYMKISLETGYNAGNAGSVADVTSGGLFLVLNADAGATGSTNHAFTFQWNTRVYFRDIN